MPEPPSDNIIRAALGAWRLVEPVTVSHLAQGFTSDVWLVRTPDVRLVAKLAYDDQSAFEGGLRAAAIADRCGIPSGAPLLTANGELTVMVAALPGQRHPLALLRFVAGEPLDLRAPDAAHVVGGMIGHVHRALREAGNALDLPDRLFPFLTEEQPELGARFPWLMPAIQRAIGAVREFEATMPVTYGITYGDDMEFVRETGTGRIGLLDWGTVGRGPLLFDLAIAVEMLHRAGSEGRIPLVCNYVAEAAVTPDETRGLDRYIALLWARQARFFAWRIAHNATTGNVRPDGNEHALEAVRRRLDAS